MVSEKKLEANRPHPQPSTAAAFTLSSALLARCGGLLPGEDPALHQACIDGILTRYRPQDPLQSSLILRLAHLAWQLGRTPAVFAAILDRLNTDRTAEVQRKNQAELDWAEEEGEQSDLESLPDPLAPLQNLAELFAHHGNDHNPILRLQAYEVLLERQLSRTLWQLLQLRRIPQAPIEPTASPEPPSSIAAQNEPTPPPQPTAPVQIEAADPVQKEATAPPLTLSPCHPVTVSSSPSPRTQSEPTAPPPPPLTAAQRRRLRIAARNGAPLDLGPR